MTAQDPVPLEFSIEIGVVVLLDNLVEVLQWMEAWHRVLGP